MTSGSRSERHSEPELLIVIVLSVYLLSVSSSNELMFLCIEFDITYSGLEICGILVANATVFSRLLPGFSCGSKHLLLP